MKNKKILLILGLFTTFLFAGKINITNGVNYQKDLKYKNLILDYVQKVNIPKNRLKNPFFKVVEQKEIEISNKKRKIKKYIKINLLSILNNNVYIEYKEFQGNNTNAMKIWVKPGEHFGICIYKRLINLTAIFNCDGKIIKKTLKTKINIKFN